MRSTKKKVGKPKAVSMRDRMYANSGTTPPKPAARLKKR
jgi:hypothetical protein